MGCAATDANHTRAQTLARPLELHAAPDRHRQFATTILAKLEDQKCGSLQASDSCFHHPSQPSFRDESNSPRLLPLAALLESNVQFRKGLATAPAPSLSFSANARDDRLSWSYGWLCYALARPSRSTAAGERMRSQLRATRPHSRA